MPFTDWTLDALKGTFSSLIRRIDRCLKKLLQRASTKVNILNINEIFFKFGNL